MDSYAEGSLSGFSTYALSRAREDSFVKPVDALNKNTSEVWPGTKIPNSAQSNTSPPSTWNTRNRIAWILRGPLAPDASCFKSRNCSALISPA